MKVLLLLMTALLLRSPVRYVGNLACAAHDDQWALDLGLAMVLEWQMDPMGPSSKSCGSNQISLLGELVMKRERVAT